MTIIRRYRGNHPFRLAPQLLLLPVLFALAACQQAGGPQQQARPQVTATVPANGDTDVALDQPLVITFSRAMNQPVTAAALQLSPAATCAPSWNPESTVLTCAPEGGWATDTTQTVTIGTGATDTNGGTLAAAFSFSFTTTDTTPDPDPDPEPPVPEVIATIPADGDDDVALDQSLRITFSRAMNEAATEAALVIVPARDCAFSWNATSTVLTCVPQGGWAATTGYAVVVGTAAVDTTGTPLAAPFGFAFTTGIFTLPLCTFGSTVFGGCTFGP